MQLSRSVLEPGGAIHLIHHSFTRGGGMERYAMVLVATFKRLGYRVIVHALKSDEELAQKLGVEVRKAAVGPVPKKLQDFFFFRYTRRSLPLATGPKLALARVCAGDLIVCGGTHRGYLKAARKVAGPFDYLQIWMEQQA